MKKRMGLRRRVLGFADRLSRDHVGAYSSQAAYFMILSFIPFVLFLTTLIKYTPLTYETMLKLINNVIPEAFQNFVTGIVQEVYRRSVALVPLTAVTALWSAVKGVQAITNGINTIYHVKETRNWLITRIMSMFYVLIFTVTVIMTLFLLVLGDVILEFIQNVNPIVAGLINQAAGRLLSQQDLIVFIFLFLLFVCMYRFLPNRRVRLIYQIPGAVFASVFWLATSHLFSLYFLYWPSFNRMYGSVSTIIMIMLWMYFCMNILLMGAEINSYFEMDFRKANDVISNSRRSRKEENATEKKAKNADSEKEKQSD